LQRQELPDRGNGATRRYCQGGECRPVYKRSKGRAPSLLSLDQIAVNLPPLLRKIRRPILHFRENVDDRNRRANRPGHSFTRERLDVATGIANRQHAMSAQMKAAARQGSGAAQAKILKIRQTGLAAGIQDISHERRGPALVTASGRIKRRCQVDVAALHTDNSHITTIADVHVD